MSSPTNYFALDTIETDYHIAEYDSNFATGDLAPDFPVHPYVGSDNKVNNWTGKQVRVKRSDTHWGQRKLLLGEIDLLCRLDKTQNYVVVYAGAADGRHMPILTKLFPNITLHLYDPRPFYQGIKSNRILINPYNIEGKEGWFTDETAQHYSEYKNIVFISDIRCEPTEAQIIQNQADQQRWVKMMRPVLSMLKLKLPYPDYEKTDGQYYTYMKGTIRFQAWAPVTSAETRLIVEQNEIDIDVNYPINRYERNCSWYNFVLRNHSYKNTTVFNIFGSYIDPWTPLGFDFAYEIEIIKKYLKIFDIEPTNFNIRQYINMFNKVLITPGSKFGNYLKSNYSKRKSKQSK
jgi:hypothetical protein